MKNSYKKGLIALVACMMSGLPQGMNAAQAAGTENVFRLDSVVTKNKDGVTVLKRMYGYDDALRKLHDVGVAYSEWTTPPFAPSPVDSIAYEYGEGGHLAKETYYSPDVVTPGVWTQSRYITYEWNAAGQMTKSTQWNYNANIEDYVDMSMDEYTYAADGSLETCIVWRRSQGAPWDTNIYDLLMEEKQVYSDFLAVDKPRKVETYRYQKAVEGQDGVPPVEEGWVLSLYSLRVYGETQLLDSVKYYQESYETREWGMYAYEVSLYDEEGRLTEQRNATQDYETGELSVTGKTYYAYDADGNLSKISGENYYSYNDSWTKIDEQHYYYTRMGGESSVEQVQDARLEVYHAAAAHQVEVIADGAIDAVYMYAADGRRVAEVAVRGDRAVLSTVGIPRGVYVVSVSMEGVTLNRKVYVEQ